MCPDITPSSTDPAESKSMFTWKPACLFTAAFSLAANTRSSPRTFQRGRPHRDNIGARNASRPSQGRSWCFMQQGAVLRHSQSQKAAICKSLPIQHLGVTNLKRWGTGWLRWGPVGGGGPAAGQGRFSEVRELELRSAALVAARLAHLISVRTHVRQAGGGSGENRWIRWRLIFRTGSWSAARHRGAAEECG